MSCPVDFPEPSWPHGVMAMMYDVMAAWRLRPGVEA